MARLEGKSAVITGAASGIGRATALKFAAEGAAVAILDRTGDAAREVEQQVRAAGRTAFVIEVDLADASATEETIRQSAQQLGGLDILVNNAATFSMRDFFELTVEDWRHVLDVNLTAYFLCARTAAAEMRKRGGGAIVNIASVHQRITEPRSGPYAASKGAVAQLTRNLAVEFAPLNIVVNAISPGFVRTAMSIVDGVDETTTPHFQDYYVKFGRIPLRRAGMPEEIAAAALFLASRECGYLTGADLTVDGGLTITL